MNDDEPRQEMTMNPTHATPYTPTNLDRLDDLAAAAYSSHALRPHPWAGLNAGEKDRWRSIVGFLLDIALDPGEHNDGPAMTRIRADAIGARQVADGQFSKFAARFGDPRAPGWTP